jgi:hypothetical protein
MGRRLASAESTLEEPDAVVLSFRPKEDPSR